MTVQRTYLEADCQQESQDGAAESIMDFGCICRSAIAGIISRVRSIISKWGKL